MFLQSVPHFSSAFLIAWLCSPSLAADSAERESVSTTNLIEGFVIHKQALGPVPTCEIGPTVQLATRADRVPANEPKWDPIQNELL